MEENKEEKTEKPSWVKIKKEELERIIIDLAKNGEALAKIGLILRDKYGIPKTRIFGRKIKEILKEKDVVYKSEKDIAEGKIKRLRNHIAKNKQDHAASRALTKKLWATHRLEKNS